MPTTVVPDTGNFDTATKLTFPYTDKAGYDWRRYLVRALTGDILFLWARSNPNPRHYLQYDVTEDSSDSGSAIEMGVRFVHREGPPISITDPIDLYPNLEMRATGGGAVNAALLRGTTNSFTLNTSPHILVNYTAGVGSGTFENAFDPVAGTIQIPDDEIHRINASIYGTQGNNTKEEDIWLFARVVGDLISYDHMIGKVHVATDKSDERYIAGIYSFFGEAGNTYSLGMLASAGMGTFTMTRANFEIE